MGKLLAIIEAVLERSFILGETKEAVGDEMPKQDMWRSSFWGKD